MVGWMSISLFVFAVVVSNFAVADEAQSIRTHLQKLPVTLTALRDKLRSELNKELTRNLQMLHEHNMDWKRKTVKQAEKLMIQCAKIADASIRNSCFRKMHGQVKMIAEEARMMCDGLEFEKEQIIKKYKDKFEDHVWETIQDRKEKMVNFVKKQRKVMKKMGNKVKLAIQYGKADARRYQNIVQRQYATPSAVVLLMISVLFLFVAPLISMMMVQLVKPDEQKVELLDHSLEEKWKSQVNLAKIQAKRRSKEKMTMKEEA